MSGPAGVWIIPFRITSTICGACLRLQTDEGVNGRGVLYEGGVTSYAVMLSMWFRISGIHLSSLPQYGTHRGCLRQGTAVRHSLGQ